LSSNLL
jgi:hypothetical protein